MLLFTLHTHTHRLPKSSSHSQAFLTIRISSAHSLIRCIFNLFLSLSLSLPFSHSHLFSPPCYLSLTHPLRFYLYISFSFFFLIPCWTICLSVSLSVHFVNLSFFLSRKTDICTSLNLLMCLLFFHLVMSFELKQIKAFHLTLLYNSKFDSISFERFSCFNFLCQHRQYYLNIVGLPGKDGDPRSRFSGFESCLRNGW